MTRPISPPRSGVIRRSLRTHFNVPLYRNGYWLIGSTLASSVFGAVFWMVAARMYTAEAVGLGSAAISAMTFLASIASLNLFNGLNRFLPRAGHSAGRLVTFSFLAATVASVVAGIIFLLGIDFWSPSLAHLADNWWFAVWFCMAVAGWAVFHVEDGALAALRASSWVAGSNLAFSAAKIILLVVLAITVPPHGVFLSWTLPVIPTALVVIVAIHRRLIPRHIAVIGTDVEHVGPRAMARFVGGDYAASLVWTATTNLLPVIVLEISGAESAGHFYLAWTVAYVLYLISRNMSMSLLTESSLQPALIYGMVYKMMRQTAILVVPAALVVVAAAPLIMELFGPEYATESLGTLRLLALSAIPSVVTSAYMAFLRFQRRIRALFVLMAALTVQVLPLSWIFLSEYGIVGVGAAWLGAHILAAVVLLATELRPALARDVRASAD